MCAWRSGERLPLRFFGRTGGIVPLPDEIAREIQHMMAVVGSPKSEVGSPWSPKSEV